MQIIKNNEKGFTLVSYLMAFSLFIFALPLLTKVFQMMPLQSNNERIAIEFFYTHLYEDLIGSLDVTVKRNEIQMMEANGDKVGIARVYKTSSNNVVRSIRGGNEIYIRDIRSIQFDEIDNHITVKIETTKGNIYEKTIALEI